MFAKSSLASTVKNNLEQIKIIKNQFMMGSNISFEKWLKKNFTSFDWDWAHLIYIRKYLDEILSKKIKRLMIFCPPRHGKSEMTTIRFAVYYLLQNPAHKIIIGAYNQMLANKFSRKCRRIAGEFIPLNNERLAVEDWETSLDGGIRAVGVGGGITGQGGNCLVGNTIITTNCNYTTTTIEELFNNYISGYYNSTDGNYKHHGKLKVLSVDENGNISYDEVVAVHKRSINKTYKITFGNIIYEQGFDFPHKENDNTIEVTGEHLIFTNSGWREACDLNVGDELFSTSQKNIVDYTRRSDLNLPLSKICMDYTIENILSRIRFDNIYKESHGKKHSCISVNKIDINEIKNSYIFENWNNVESIEIIEKEQYVYDIQVKDNHNFFANNVLVHNCIIIDDPVKNREEANSVAYREKVWDWYTDDLYTRLEPDAPMILIMTRWHADDLAGRILESSQAKEWTVISLPALAEDNDLLNREIGEALCPERYSRDDLLQIKDVMGVNFQALYQQSPAPAEGNIIKINELVDYEEFPSFNFIIQSWDTAFKDGEENDFSVGTCWGVTNHGYYLVDVIKGRFQFSDLKEEVKKFANRYSPDVVIIEDKASGQSLIQELRRNTRLPIAAIKVDRDKVTRVHSITPLIESGQVYIPKQAIWKNDLLYSLKMFPFGKYDDDVDSVSLALNYLSKRFANMFPVFRQYNDELHMCDNFDSVDFIDVCVGLHVGKICTAVILGVTDLNRVFALKEFITVEGLEHLLNNILLPHLSKYYSQFNVTYVTHGLGDNIDSSLILDRFNIESEHYLHISSIEMIAFMRKSLERLVSGRPVINIYKDGCTDLREGFNGAYGYKSRSDVLNFDYSNEPENNKYRFVHEALQIVVYHAITEIIEAEDNNLMKSDYYEEGRSTVGGY
jgi:predicted phage terminase large subunit-like protein